MGKNKLLVVEDDAGLQTQLRWRLDAYEVMVADDRESAMAQLRRHQAAVVTMDLGLPPDPDGASEGLALLPQILAAAPDTKVIVLTGNQDRAFALKAVAMGAYDFHPKPLDGDTLALVIERAFICMACSRRTGACCKFRRIRHWPASSAVILRC
jgi:two-component system NtrC family response regulator